MKNSIGDKTIFRGFIGRCSYVGSGCYLNARIGRYCSVGSNVQTLSARHPSSIFVSTSPIFYSLLKQTGYTYVTKQKYTEQTVFEDKGVSIIIGNDVWIGDNVMIMGGVTIGDVAIIGAGSLVTHDVNPYSIVGGIPAKEIRKRFSDSEVTWLEKFRWWEKSEEWIEKNAETFDNIKQFIAINKENGQI